MPANSSPSNASSSRSWRSGAMRKTAARQVSAPLKRAPAAAQAPAGLVNVDGRGVADVPEQTVVGDGQRMPGALHDRVDRAARKRAAKQLLEQLDEVASGDAVSHRQRCDRGLQSRAEGAGWDLRRQLCPRGAAAVGAAQAMEPVLAEDHRDRRQLRDLVAGLPANGATLCLAEAVAAGAALGPLVEELIDRLDRPQQTTVP